MPTNTSDKFYKGTVVTQVGGQQTVGGKPLWVLAAPSVASSDARRVMTTRTTNRTSGYFTQVRKGNWINPLQYTVRKREWILPVGSHRDLTKNSAFLGSTVQSWSGCLQSTLGYSYFGDISVYEPSASQKNGINARIDAKLLSKIKSDRINLAQTFAERKQTVSLIGNTIQRFARSAIALRRGDLNGFSKALGISTPTARTKSRFRREYRVSPKDTFSDWWLEYTYGWKPLLSDVYGAMEVFEKPISDPVAVAIAAGTERYEDIVVSNGTYFRLTTYRYATIRRKKIIYYELSPQDTSQFVRSAAQLGLTNPALLAWELLPFSFVVDWFLPIGNYLSSLDATFGLRFKSGSFSDVWVRSSYRTETGAGLPGGASVYTVGFSTSRYTEKWFDRFPITSFPSPVLPSFKPPWSASHITSGLALLNQIFLRK